MNAVSRPNVRDDGTNHSDYPHRHAEDYDQYLRDRGMDGNNPWEEWANTAVGPDGELLSGWVLENTPHAARVPKEHSETAWLTTRAIDFIEAHGDQPWLCHLSYIKPHWPYLAPAPYNDMFSARDLSPVNRGNSERQSDHPLLRAWMDMRVSKSFSRDEVRDLVAPVYMGLIKELDDQLGWLFAYLRDCGRMNDTMIVFCSDHGDNMGDHWMGEKDLFYDCSARYPFDRLRPAPGGRCDPRYDDGSACRRHRSYSDFPRFLRREAQAAYSGRPFVAALLHGEETKWRDFCVSEYDYSTRDARRAVGVDQGDARLVMIFDGRWKYIHVEKMRPMLFDLKSDPNELNDLGADSDWSDEIERLSGLHFEWSRRHHNRIIRPVEGVEAMTDEGEPPGIFIGYWDRDELEADAKSLPLHAER